MALAMLRRIDVRGRRLADIAIPRPHVAGEPPVAAVREIIAAVRRDGDAAVRALTARLDGAAVDILRVLSRDCDDALRALDPAMRAAMEEAHANIEAYHRAQLHGSATFSRAGVCVREEQRPVERAGCYVPRQLLSTVLMTAVPARVAGVGEVVLCTPPGPDGRVAPGVLAAAALAGVDEVYRVGGAQAIAAMAYGTESISPVDVIVGPGNVYVSVAKREVAGAVGVPSSFAGPSEVVVVADGSVPAEYAAIDLMVQVEHGPDSVAWLVAWDADVAERIVEMVGKLLETAPRRDIIAANLAANAYVALVDGPAQAIEVVNRIAPEHLELMTAEPDALVPAVRNAGAVFCGAFAPASVGDYVAGPNHVLPTYGSARWAGALRVDDFLKHIHVVSVDEAGLARLGPHVAALAVAEGLPTHAESVRMRGAR
jgi:histidinol dehydrogenase